MMTATVTDTSDEQCALMCMLVSNPQDGVRAPGWQKRVNDLIRALRDERNKMREALEAAEKADQKAINCEEHQPQDAPESCEHCFPLADNARQKRWAALGINQLAT